MDSKQFKTQVVIPSIVDLSQVLPGCVSGSAINLLLGTVAQESDMGEFIIQINNEMKEKDKAVGVYQMERPTHKDIWENFIYFRPPLHNFMILLLPMKYSGVPNSDQLMYDMRYATMMARIHYWRVEAALPEQNDVDGMSHYWKDHFNTEDGKGTPEQYVNAWNKYVAD